MNSDIEKQKTVVYINSENMGAGDDGLGGLLMGTFLSTLEDFAREVSHILLVNAGVKMVCTGSDKLETMQALADSGIEILSCTTCLNHYRLQDKVGAGSKSTMFSILEVLTGTDKILTP